MKIADYKGYEIHLPMSGGKAGKGCAKTSTFQVRRDSMVVKQFRFTLGVNGNSREALRKAKTFIDKQEVALNECNC